MKSLLKQLLLFLLLSFSIVYPSLGIAGVDLPWSTTYDCDEWTQSDGRSVNDVNCDGLAGHGGWVCSGGRNGAAN